MVDSVSLSPYEIQALMRYQSALQESQRDVQKLTEARNTLMAVVWTRAGGDAETPFRIGDDGKSLVADKEKRDGVAS